MLRGNLSTRPFYNERIVHLVLVVTTVVVGLLTVFSVRQFVSLSRQQSELSARIGVDEQRAATLRREAARVRSGIDQTELATIVSATREVNRAIDERVFSWTALFNTIEQTIPASVALTAVYPSIDDNGRIVVRLVVGATDIDEVGLFMDALERAGPFSDLRSVEELRVDDGSYVVTFDGQYTPPAGGTPAPTGEVASRAAAASDAGAGR